MAHASLCVRAKSIIDRRTTSLPSRNVIEPSRIGKSTKGEGGVGKERWRGSRDAPHGNHADSSDATLARFRRVDKRRRPTWQRRIAAVKSTGAARGRRGREGAIAYRSAPPRRGAARRRLYEGRVTESRGYWLLGTIVTFAATIYDDWNSRGRVTRARAERSGARYAAGEPRHLIKPGSISAGPARTEDSPFARAP